MKKHLYTVLLSLLCISLQAQNPVQQTNADIKKEIDALFNQNKFREAIPLAEKIVANTKSNPDTSYANALLDLGVIYTVLGEYPKAEPLFQETVNIRKKLLGEQDPQYARAVLYLSILYSYLDKFDQNEKLLKELINSLESIKSAQSSLYAEAMNNLAVLYKSKGQYERALPLYEQSLRLSEKTDGKENNSYASNLNNMATAYYAMGRYDDAEVLYNEVLTIRKKILGEKSSGYAVVLNNMGALYNEIKRYDEAESFYQQTLDIYKEIYGTEHPEYAKTLNNLAVLYSATDRFDEAAKAYEQVLEIQANGIGKKHPVYANSLMNCAEIYSKLNQFNKAEPMHITALAIIKEQLGKEHPLYANGLNFLAILYDKENLSDKALPLFKEALEIRKRVLGEKHSSYIISLNNIASSYILRKNYPEALSYCLKSIAANAGIETLADKEGASLLEAIAKSSFMYYSLALNSLENLYKIALTEEEKKLTNAYGVSQLALKISNTFRNEFASESDKLRILSNQGPWVAKAIHQGELLAQKGNASDYYAELFGYAEFNKSILLADATKAQRARNLGDLPDSLALKEISLQNKQSQLKKQLIEVTDDNKRAKLQAAKNALDLEVANLKKHLESNFPKYYKLKYAPLFASAKDIQGLLAPESLFLEYYVAEDSLFLFLIAKDVIKLFPIPVPKRTLEEQSGLLRKALSDYDFIKKEEAMSLYCETAYWFYQQLLEKALKSRTEKKLIIVADGVLGHLPFEAFLTAKPEVATQNYGNLAYLMRDYTISYNYSASLWKENLALPQKTGKGKILAMAASYGEKADSSATRTSRAPHLRNLRDALIDLPAAKAEVEGLSKHFAGNFLIGKTATESAFKANANESDIIHLAMHGLLNTQHPILSSLAFTEDGDSTNDNFLQAYEIAHLSLGAQLVVLSACETGYGKFQQGEGVMSLARSFMYAGVPSLVVSMWQVNDASTSLIMQDFYQNLAKGMDKAEALRQSKLNYLKGTDGIAAHPAFWAPFIQLGDSRPIAVSVRGGGWSLWWIGGGLAAIAAIGGGAIALRRKRAA